MHNINITCPHCDTQFDGAEQLEQHFQQIELKDKLLTEQQNELIQLKEAKKADDQQKQELVKQINNAKLLAKKELQKDLDESVKNAYQKGFDAAELNVKAIRKEAKEAAKEELKGDLKKTSDKAFQEGLLAAEQRLQDRQDQEVTDLKKQITVEKLDKQRLQKHIEELREKAQQRNVELQGEAQELYLEDMLRKHFPNDEVQEVKKGASGHDCTFVINHRNQEGLAKIAFESKNTKHFSADWVDKLNKTMMEKKIPYGVIVTKALPKDFDHIQWRLDSIVIIPFKTSSILTTAEMLRELLIKEYEIRKVSLLDDSEQAQLYRRLMSPQMRMQVTALMRSYLATSDLIDDDERANAKSIIKRQANLNEQKQKLLKIFGAVAGSDSKLADNLIFSDEEIQQAERIGHIKSIKGPQS